MTGSARIFPFPTSVMNVLGWCGTLQRKCHKFNAELARKKTEWGYRITAVTWLWETDQGLLALAIPMNLRFHLRYYGH